MPRMQQRRDTAANWTAANPTLASGEIGIETDTGRWKVGNGVAVWTALTYFTAAGVHAANHAANGTDPVTIVASQVSDFTAAVVAAAPPTTNASLLTSGTLSIARIPTGTSSSTVCIGNDSRLSDSRTPTGAAGGDLTGTFPNPSLATTGVVAGTYTSVTVDAKGRITAGTNPAGYSLPIASASTLGGVRIGAGISIDESGVISASGGGSYTLPNATTSTLGGVIVGAGLGVASGTVSVTYGSTANTACQGNDPRLSDSRAPTGAAGGDLTGTFPNPTLVATAVAAGSYGSATSVGTFTVDAKGRLTAAGSASITAAGIGAAAATHTHSASDITSGTVATARLGSGTASNTTFLRGDGQWATPAGGSVTELAEYTTASSFPATGAAGILYIDKDRSKVFRWDNAYVELGPVGGGPALAWSSAPATSTATGTAGSIAYNSNYVYVATGANQWRRAALTTWVPDPFWANVSLLMRGDGDLADLSSYGRSVTAYGNAGFTGAQKKFGSGSLSFDGNGDYMLTARDSAMQFGTGDFAVECWVNLTSRVGLFPAIVSNYANYSSGNIFGLFAGHNGAVTDRYQVDVAGVTFPALQSSSSIAYGSWQHLAISRSSGVLNLYVNGVREASAACTANLSGNGSWFNIGASGDELANPTLTNIHGFIDDLRVTVGSARGYSGTTISVPTEQYPAE